jgi:lipopolysaccharide biosynthesis protein
MQDVCLFAHFDKDDKIDDYVLRYLAQLRELGFSIVFISTSNLSAAETARLQGVCCDVILRDNAGLDFASWTAGFAKHASAIGGRLLLANDSVYGPIGSLNAALERLTRVPADFYGMVESIEVAPHLQSWFLLFEPWVFGHPTFTSILAQPFSAMTKRQIIENGEVALSCRLTEAGFRYGALCLANRKVISARHPPSNPTQILWRELLFDFGVPFLKVELLRNNPIGVEDATTILQSVRQIDPAICDLISSHLARTAGASKSTYSWRSRGARYRVQLVREYYGHRGKGRTLAAAWTVLKLDALTLLATVVRKIRRLFGLSRGRA